MAINKNVAKSIAGDAYIPPGQAPKGMTEQQRAEHNAKAITKAMGNSAPVKAEIVKSMRANIREWMPGGGKMSESAVDEVAKLLERMAAGHTTDATRQPANRTDPWLSQEPMGADVPPQSPYEYSGGDAWLNSDAPDDPGFSASEKVTGMPAAANFKAPGAAPQNLGSAMQYAPLTKSDLEYLHEENPDDPKLRAAIEAKLGKKPTEDASAWADLHGGPVQKRIRKALLRADSK